MANFTMIVKNLSKLNDENACSTHEVINQKRFGHFCVHRERALVQQKAFTSR